MITIIQQNVQTIEEGRKLARQILQNKKNGSATINHWRIILATDIEGALTTLKNEIDHIHLIVDGHKLSEDQIKELAHIYKNKGHLYIADSQFDLDYWKAALKDEGVSAGYPEDQIKIVLNSGKNETRALMACLNHLSQSDNRDQAQVLTGNQFQECDETEEISKSALVITLASYLSEDNILTLSTMMTSKKVPIYLIYQSSNAKVLSELRHHYDLGVIKYYRTRISFQMYTLEEISPEST